MSNMRAFIPIVLSILIALGGSYFLYNWVKEKTVPQKQVVVKESRAVPVVVAKIPIQMGTKITAEMVMTTPYFENSTPKGHFTDPKQVINRIVTAQLLEGDAVLEHRMAPTTLKTGGVSAVLKKGKRAISVKGNNVLGISGFINPGNRIDVLVTINDPRQKKEITKIVLEDLYVLASGRLLQESKQGEPAPVDVYTLEVTPEQGERLTLAANKGRLQFALRGALDSDIVLTKGVTVPELLDSFVLAEQKKQQEIETAGKGTGAKKVVRKRYNPAPKKRKVTVEVIKDLSRSKKVFTL